MYLIPRNFSDNGRIWGMFEARSLFLVIAVALPPTFLLLYLTILPLVLRGILWGVFAVFPALLILSGMANRLLTRYRFSKEAGMYVLRGTKRR